MDGHLYLDTISNVGNTVLVIRLLETVDTSHGAIFFI